MESHPFAGQRLGQLVLALSIVAIGVAAVVSLTDSDEGPEPPPQQTPPPQPTPAPAPTPTQPAAPPQPAPSPRVASDTAAKPNPLPFWGAIDCVDPSRHRRFARDGDPSPTATGAPQPNLAFRRLRVLDGDDFFGERCELGENNNRGPVAFYREGRRLRTYASFRLPADFPLGAKNFQGVLQIKQAQPADNGGGTPALSLKAYDGSWILFHSGPAATEVDKELWRIPAAKGVWTRVVIDARYSADPARGRVQIGIDANGDADFDDASETSPRVVTNTLKRELPGSDEDGLAAGDSIPSHLRVGLYHDERIACPPPAGCAIDVDNVQVLVP